MSLRWIVGKIAAGSDTGEIFYFWCLLYTTAKSASDGG
jgi:hypothetical protein